MKKKIPKYNMKKYFAITEPKYEYSKIWIDIKEYYLLKEGWILCTNYRENPNDLYYKSPDMNFQVRKDYCEKLDENDVYDTLEEAKAKLKIKLNELYKEETLKLLQAYISVLIDVENKSEEKENI